MLPSSLQVDSFQRYPSQAQALASTHLALLQQLPLCFVPSLLREWIEYDYKFPAERLTIHNEIAALVSLPPAERLEWFRPFAQLRLSTALEQFDWVNQPAQFTEQLSAYLWSSHQMDGFRAAATGYGARLRQAAPPAPPRMRRLGIAVIGQGVSSSPTSLFRRLREHGTCFSAIQPGNGLQVLLAAAAARAQAQPVPYGHWYIDGGTPGAAHPALTAISYRALEPARASLLTYMQAEIAKPGMGPEALRTHLAQLSPQQLGMGGDPLLARFQVKLLTEGSGTQIFSTTYAQWAAREVLRRTEALTLLVRFAPRQRQRPMNELLSGNQGNPELDAQGSLVDADMGAYYHWINQQRLAGSEQSSFLAWFEGHGQAVAVDPSLPRGAESHSPISMEKLVSLLSSEKT